MDHMSSRLFITKIDHLGNISIRRPSEEEVLCCTFFVFGVPAFGIDRIFLYYPLVPASLRCSVHERHIEIERIRIFFFWRVWNEIMCFPHWDFDKYPQCAI